MSQFVPRADLLVQRDLMLEAYPSIADAIRDAAFDLPEADEAVLLVSDHGKLYEFNLVAAFIWEKLQGGSPLDEIVSGLSTSFDVTAEVAERDLDGFLRFLKHIALVKVVEPPAPTGTGA